jgi:3-hydroxyacyl-CoA dehydrogenase
LIDCGQSTLVFWSSAVINDPTFVETLNKEFGRRMPEYLLYDETASDPCAVTARIKERYFNGQNVNADVANSFAMLFEDRYSNHCIRKGITEYSKLTDVYVYNFTKWRNEGKVTVLHLRFHCTFGESVISNF